MSNYVPKFANPDYQQLVNQKIPYYINPDMARMKKAKKRPKKQNVKKVDNKEKNRDDTLNFVNPTAPPVLIQSHVTADELPVYSGEYNVNFGFTDDLCSIVTEQIRTYDKAPDFTDQELQELSRCLEAASAIMSFVQVYNTSDQAFKSKMKNLYGLTKMEFELPEFIPKMIELMGETTSKVGKFRMRNGGIHTMQRLFDKLRHFDLRDRTRDQRRAILDDGDAYLFAFKDGVYFEEIKMILKRDIERRQRQRHAVQIGVQQIQFSSPQKGDLSWQEYLNILNDLNDPGSYIRDRISFLVAESPNDVGLRQQIAVGYLFMDQIMSDKCLVGAAADALQKLKRYESTLKKFYSMKKLSSLESGNTIQLANSESTNFRSRSNQVYSLESHTELDRAFMMILRPESDYVIYDQQTRNTTRNSAERITHDLAANFEAEEDRTNKRVY
jgi:hypothetical protein